MRHNIHVWMGEKEKRERFPAVIWIGEIPPKYQRGRNRKMKSSKYKRGCQERLLEERLDDKLTQEIRHAQY